MPIYFLTTALLIVSVVTNLTVEGIKKLLEGKEMKVRTKKRDSHHRIHEWGMGLATRS